MSLWHGAITSSRDFRGPQKTRSSEQSSDYQSAISNLLKIEVEPHDRGTKFRLRGRYGVQNTSLGCKRGLLA